MKLDLQVSMARVQGGDEEHPIRFEVNDRTSGVRILDFKMNLENFAKMMTGLSYIDALGDFHDGPFGCKKENKTEIIVAPKGYKQDLKEYGPLLAPYEVDGWKAYVPDLYNHHRGSDMRRVSFKRYIKPDGTVWMPKENQDAI